MKLLCLFVSYLIGDQILKSQKILKILENGADWYRQERISVSKHVGALVLHSATNEDQTVNGERQFALAA